ncbi:hypothetical protein G9F71_017990 [Clostridium sp. FP2]|uniref:hypothetical protein n=1 Tax=Clostridium sp. FP2 TaxID=2724481 RepID=UPI0013E9780F|nr:hypothetical protein [Clostridium sp. FP2]MBZ9624743.1 hypothetical protein [Clostridium sp. FP2]
MKLIKKEGKWIIYSDWYLDCFEDALNSYLREMKDFIPNAVKKHIYNLVSCPKMPFEVNVVTKGRYGRITADKYCGIQWAS